MICGWQLATELRRGKVSRAVATYWVVAWTAAEVSFVADQVLALPGSTDRGPEILAAAGLPLVTALSRVFDWGPDAPGIGQHPS